MLLYGDMTIEHVLISNAALVDTSSFDGVMTLGVQLFNFKRYDPSIL